MKKPKLLALTLVIAIMLMGAGYAAWQETLTINGTVSTGELNMQFLESYVIVGSDNLFENYFEIEPIDIDRANDNANIVISEIYPGVGIKYDLFAKNTGSIPATIESVEVDLDETDAVFANTLRVSGAVTHIREGRILPVNILPFADVSLSGLEDVLNNGCKGELWGFPVHFKGMKDWKIELGDTIMFDLPPEHLVPGFREYLEETVPGYEYMDKNNCIIFHIPLSATNEIQNEYIGAQEFSFKFNFKQFNK